jgi:hypothetical protein
MSLCVGREYWINYRTRSDWTIEVGGNHLRILTAEQSVNENAAVSDSSVSVITVQFVVGDAFACFVSVGRYWRTHLQLRLSQLLKLLLMYLFLLLLLLLVFCCCSRARGYCWVDLVHASMM